MWMVLSILSAKDPKIRNTLKILNGGIAEDQRISLNYLSNTDTRISILHSY